jgi:hypothetical protein
MPDDRWAARRRAEREREAAWQSALAKGDRGIAAFLRNCKASDEETRRQAQAAEVDRRRAQRAAYMRRYRAELRAIREQVDRDRRSAIRRRS